MLQQDVIEEINESSPWVTNLVIVPKKLGGLKVSCDLCEVNKAVIRERYALPKLMIHYTEMVLVRRADKGIQSLEGSTASQSSLGVFPFRCFNICGHRCQSYWLR